MQNGKYRKLAMQDVGWESNAWYACNQSGEDAALVHDSFSECKINFCVSFQLFRKRTLFI